MRWFGVALLSSLPVAAAADEPVEVAEVTQVAVLELKATGLDESVAKNLSELFTAEAGRIPGYKAISHSEIVDMLGFEAQKQTLGCDDEGCIAELGGALGVALVISGSVGKVGDTFVVNIKLMDSAEAKVKNRVSETLMGQVELLPPFIRMAAWRLFEKPVPAHVSADYDATKAKLELEAAQKAGDARAIAEAERMKAEAERAKADAERARAETERLRLEREKLSGVKTESADASASGGPSRRPGRTGGAKATTKGPAWARIGRTVSSLVAGLGLLGGGALHAFSYVKSRDVGEVGEARGGDSYTVYGVGTQSDAQMAGDLRSYSIYAYAAGAVGVVGFVVFTLLMPDAPEAESTAVRFVPTGNGLAVTF